MESMNKYTIRFPKHSGNLFYYTHVVLRDGLFGKDDLKNPHCISIGRLTAAIVVLKQSLTGIM
jgi:hypothetical protein